jgi:transketolase
MGSLRNQFAKTVTSIGHEDKDLVVVVGDISHGIFSDFRDIAPDRYFNIGICEPAMASICAGLNKTGHNPVIHTIAPFLIERSFEQIKLDFEYQGLSGNFVSVGGSFDYAQLGCSHHSYLDVALIRSLPSAKIFMPGSDKEFDHFFRCYYKEPGVKYFRLTENSHSYDNLDMSEAGVKVNSGSDITLVTCGASLQNCIEACKLANSIGISVDLIYLTKIWPIDASLIESSCEKTHNLVVVSELSSVGGLGQIVQDAVNAASVSLENFVSIEIKDFVRDYGTYQDLRNGANIGVKNILEQLEGLSSGQ